MTKQKSLKILNDLIDKMIIKGETTNEEYKRLCKTHKSIVFA